jgi:hypothetical protein
MLGFTAALDPTSASNSGNYQVCTVTTRKVKKKVARILPPVPKFNVSYTAGSKSVTLNLAGRQTFSTGGQLTVLGGVTGATGGSLSATTVFTIAKGGNSIGPE